MALFPPKAVKLDNTQYGLKADSATGPYSDFIMNHPCQKLLLHPAGYLYSPLHDFYRWHLSDQILWLSPQICLIRKQLW